MNHFINLFFFGIFLLFFSVLGGCVATTGNTSRDSVKPFLSKSSLKTPEAQACINAAANKYFLPTKVIIANDSFKAQDGSTVVFLKVDLRDAECIISNNGSIRRITDTSPKSADQIEAEKAAAEGRIL